MRRTTRAASATSSATRASTAASPSTSSPSCSPPARARSTGSRRATRTSPWRCWPASARPSTPRSSPSAPARPTCGSPARPRCPASIDVKTSKNAGVALLCASLLNRGRTTLRKVARIEEVNRLLEVLTSLGVQTRWLNDDNDLEIIPPAELDLANIDEDAARRTRSIIMFLGPLLHRDDDLRPALRRRLQPRHPHRRAAHVGAAPVRPRGQGDRRHATTRRSTGRSSRAARSCSPSAATPSPRTR